MVRLPGHHQMLSYNTFGSLRAPLSSEKYIDGTLPFTMLSIVLGVAKKQ